LRSTGTLIESFCTGTFCFVFIALGRIYKVMTVIEALNKLKLAGLPDKQAEAIVETFEQRDRSWFETQFEKMRTEIEKVRGEIKDAKFEMIRWIVGSVIVGTLISHFWK
jgi:ABC-type cobalt transport system substrate-binding protein